MMSQLSLFIDHIDYVNGIGTATAHVSNKTCMRTLWYTLQSKKARK